MPLIKLYANLRTIASKNELTTTGANLENALFDLVDQVPALDGIIFENRQLRRHIVININGHNTNELDTLITEQDIIAIFPPIAGG